MKRVFSLYSPSYPRTLVYMLQRSEYHAKSYFRWLNRVEDFSKVAYRGKLKKTSAGKLLLMFVSLGILGQLILGLILLAFGIKEGSIAITAVGISVVVAYPIVWAYLIVFPLEIGRLLIVNPKERKLIHQSRAIFKNHPGVKIAVAGSYGKTTMKELLNTVLGEGKNVAATPANKNVSISHALFARKLTGKEDIVIIEYGEGAPGDIKRFADITHPSLGIITGLAPAHLDQYKDLHEAGKDIFSLVSAVGDNNTYVNAESVAAMDFIKPGFHMYGSDGVLGWKVHNVRVGFEGVSFVMKKGSQQLSLRSGLMGRHQIGPLALVGALAKELGLTSSEIEKGISKTDAFEHRMQARAIRGAWIVDDTYNGNIDGMKAGLALLKELPGKRKIYVTPGLVEQGVEVENVHNDLGREIAKNHPDKVVLMLNSVTQFIRSGLEDGNYKGEVQIEHYPLDFYVNLEHFIASGDVIMLQNDWPDNYN